MRYHTSAVKAALLLLLFLSAHVSPAVAIDFHVLSSEHSISTATGPKVTHEQVISADGGARHCVLVEMDTLANRGVVTFTYDSNISITDVRSPLLVSTHRPSTSTKGLAEIDSIESIVEVRAFTPYELRQFNDAADNKERELAALEQKQGGRKQGEPSLSFDRDAAREITVNFNAATSTVMSGITRVRDGTHAVCFTLDPRTYSRKVNDKRLVERVTIGLREISTTRQAVLTPQSGRKRPSRGQAVPRWAGKVPQEAWSNPKELLRRELEAIAAGVGDDAADNLVSSASIKAKLDTLRTCRSQLSDILRMTDELLGRFERMRKTAESTFTRVWVCTAFVIVVACIVVWMTFRYTRNVIVKRKLI